MKKVSNIVLACVATVSLAGFVMAAPSKVQARPNEIAVSTFPDKPYTIERYKEAYQAATKYGAKAWEGVKNVAGKVTDAIGLAAAAGWVADAIEYSPEEEPEFGQPIPEGALD